MIIACGLSIIKEEWEAGKKGAEVAPYRWSACDRELLN